MIIMTEDDTIDTGNNIHNRSTRHNISEKEIIERFIRQSIYIPTNDSSEPIPERDMASLIEKFFPELEKPETIEFKKMAEEQKNLIIDIIKQESGDKTIPQICKILDSKGINHTVARNVLLELYHSNKILLDRDECICWTYNPVLAGFYRSRPELQIR